jgi:histidinol dehydrogenase
MNIIKNPKRELWNSLLARPTIDFESLMNSVGDILKNVKEKGDVAVKEYSLKFDKVKLDDLAVSDVEIACAKFEVDEDLKKAIDVARKNIEQFHAAQMHGIISCETTPGVKCWQKAVAIERVGLYIPGGTAPLLSTVLMLGIPATLAGCREIVLCTPPDKNGKIHSTILYAAKLLGIKKIFKIGGAQAIAAMAYGTESVPKVYKIFGPGNQYVQAAKMKVSLENVAIDMPAGPSELAVIADDSSIPAFVASDLLSQAEHGIDSQVLLVTKSISLIEKVKAEIEVQLKALPRKDIARKALDNSKIILMENDDEIVDLINSYAPEHLIVVTENYMVIAERIFNVGSVFLGNFTPESAGDYASGTNHTLPTNGTAKAYSGVNLNSFMKKITYQEISKYGLFNIGPSVEKLAVAEELEAHQNSVRIRITKFANNYK